MFKCVDKKLLQDYLRNIGLASVIGCLTGFFLKPHNHHTVISIACLFLIGIIASYFGMISTKEIKEENKNV